MIDLTCYGRQLGVDLLSHRVSKSRELEMNMNHTSYFRKHGYFDHVLGYTLRLRVSETALIKSHYEQHNNAKDDETQTD